MSDPHLRAHRANRTQQVLGSLRSTDFVADRRLRAKEKEKVFKEMQKEKNIGEGVSEFAQKVFNGLAKTMHCYWDGTDIVIKMGSSAEDEVRIKDPYEVAEGKNSSMVERVKLVLKGETERIRQLRAFFQGRI